MTIGSKRNRRPLFSLEMIDFQKDDFGKQLESIIAEMIEKVKSNEIKSRDSLAKTNYPEAIEKLVFKRLGIKLKVIVNTKTPGAIMPFFMNKQHVLVNEDVRWQLDGIPDQIKIKPDMFNKKGTVDLKNAKLTGVFSTYEHECWLDVYGNYIEMHMTAAHITAILLHELGHAFTYYEFSDRMSTTNQVMANIADYLFNQKDDRTSEYLYAEIKKIGTISKQEAEQMASDNRIVAGIKMVKIYVDSVKSLMPNSKYDETASEQLADQFASRFGYGRDLIEALHSIYVRYGTPELASSVSRFMCYVFGFIADLTMPAIIFGWLLAVSLPIAVCVGLLMSVFIVNMCGDAHADMTYDTLKVRYVRVRQQYIAAIKDANMDNDHMVKYIKDIDALDKLIAQIKPFETILSILGNLVFTMNRDVKKDILIQRAVEDLAHNNLFLSSANFKVLSSTQ